MDQELKMLSWSKVPDLVKIYEQNGMSSYGTYVILKLFLEWHTSFENIQINFFCPGGEVDYHGTFVVVFPENINILFDSLHPDTGRIKPLLKKCIEAYVTWWGSLLFGPVDQRFWTTLEEIISDLGLETTEGSYASSYYIDKSEAEKLEIRCPTEVYLGSLRQEHASLINSVWPHRFEGSLDLVKNVLHRNGGVGVFLKENNELVSWALYGHYGGPSFLQTLEAYKRKGYGILSTLGISVYVAKKGIHPILYIVEHNIPSQKLFNKLKFKKLRDVCWTSVAKPDEHSRDIVDNSAIPQ